VNKGRSRCQGSRRREQQLLRMTRGGELLLRIKKKRTTIGDESLGR
jgi:hypothetical protein